MKKHYRKKNNRKKREELPGLQVKVFNNNVEGALKVFKKKIKNSNLMLELREKAYFEKPSDKKRRKKNLAKLRQKHSQNKVQKNY